jgi:L-iditol 2-dehydrogenase
VEQVGVQVRKCRPGDLVAVDPVLTCWSLGRSPVCEYCETGDPHQCEQNRILGVTAPGAFQDWVAVPETNIIRLPKEMPLAKAVLIEPLGCVLHASDRMEQAPNRYTFDGKRPIRYVLILGAGPSGLLFLQYLRNVKKFDGEIFVAETKQRKLALVKRLGGTPLDVGRTDLISEIHTRTRGERVHYLIEATGSGSVFDWIPAVVRRQATVQMYGAGHAGRDIGCLTPFQVMEIVVVTSAGASGGYDPDGTPSLYRRSKEHIESGSIDSEAILSHRYETLGEMQGAFDRDSAQEDFIKGAYLPPP